MKRRLRYCYIRMENIGYDAAVFHCCWWMGPWRKYTRQCPLGTEAMEFSSQNDETSVLLDDPER